MSALHRSATQLLGPLALICAGLTVGRTRLHGLPPSPALLTLAAGLQALGVAVDNTGPTDWQVQGVGLAGLHQPQQVIDLGDSPLLLGVLATHPLTVTLTASPSLCAVALSPLIAPLMAIGTRFTLRDGVYLPGTLTGANHPIPLTHTLTEPTALHVACLLLAGLMVPGHTCITESDDGMDRLMALFRSLFSRFGVHIGRQRGMEGNSVWVLTGQPELEGERQIDLASLVLNISP